ncbi:MAG: hypothetical protein ABEH40_08670 [Haloferacaceae archaeon]
MRPAPFLTGVVLAGIVAGLGALMSPPHTAYAVVVGLAVAIPLLRAEGLDLPDDPGVADRAAGDRALTAAVGALIVGCAVVFAIRSSLPAEQARGLPVYVIAASAAVAGSFAADLREG